MKLQQEFDTDRRSFAGALFTTFVFNSEYFEGTLLPMLNRKSVQGNTVVCIDAGSYQSTTDDTDIRPKRAGDAYYLSPMRVQNGRFHPKVYLFGGEERTVGFVGSANLTGAAFDQNQEVVTRFDVSNIDEPTGPDVNALADIHRFFSQLVGHPAAEAMGDTAVEEVTRILEATDWVTKAGAADSDEPASTAVLHNLETPLLEQLTNRIDDQNEDIQHVDIIAPFFGEGMAVPETFTGQGIPTTLWLQQDQTQISLAKLQQWQREAASANPIVYEYDRYVHGKVLLCKTASAVYCLAGSPNASQAALLSAADSASEYANIEVAVFRRIPDPNHYEYLLEDLAAHRVEYGLEEFSPQEAADYRPPAPSSEVIVDLLSIEFTERNVSAGGGLSGRVRITTAVNDSDHLELRIHPTTDGDPFSLHVAGSDLSESDTDRPDYYDFSQRITDESKLPLLTRPAYVVPVWNETAGTKRWLAIKSPNVVREAESAAKNDGVDSVWRTVYTMFLGNDEDRAEQLEFLGTLATKLASNGPGSDGGQAGQQEPDANTDTDDDDKLSEGVSLPTYSGTTSTGDPGSQLEGYYETWVEHLRKLRNALLSGDHDAKQLLRLAGERLAEINRTNTWLHIVYKELQRREQDFEDFPKHLPREYTNTLYSQTEPGFGSENTSETAQLIRDAQSVLDEDDRDALQAYIGSNILFGRLIAEKLLAKDQTLFNNYYGSDFDTLLSKCLVEKPTTTRNEELVTVLTDALWDQFGDLPNTFESASLSYEPPSEFIEKQHTRRYIKHTILLEA